MASRWNPKMTPTEGPMAAMRHWSSKLHIPYGRPLRGRGCRDGRRGSELDVFGYHALTCSHLGGLGVRHNKLRDVWLRYFMLAGIPAQKETPSLLPGSAARPADIFVPHFLPPDADTAK